MRNNGESAVRPAQEGKQVTKTRNHDATLGIIRAGEQDVSNGIIGPIAGATPKPSYTAWQYLSKDTCEDFPANSLWQIKSKTIRPDRAGSETGQVLPGTGRTVS